MLLATKTEELRSILELFYNLCGIRIVIFDNSFHEIIAFPTEKCPFCREICSKPDLAEKCAESDFASFENCRKTGDIIIYKCHAGLTEATVPLSYGGINIGYVMFGQITDIKDKTDLGAFVRQINREYDINCSAKGLKYRSKKQISAAAELLEICTEYIILKELVVPQYGGVATLAEEYNGSFPRDLEQFKISDAVRKRFAEVSANPYNPANFGCRTNLPHLFKRSDSQIGPYRNRRRVPKLS